MSPVRQSRWTMPGLLALLLGAYTLTWFFLSIPYRPFPSDDGRLWSHMLKGTMTHVQRGYEPVTELSLRAFADVGKLFVPLTPSFLVAYAVACYAGLLAVLAWLALRLSSHWPTALVAALLFAFSAWPITYLFFMSYTPLATWYAWLAWGLLLASPAGNTSRRLLLAAGALAGVACFGCSVSGAISLLGIGWLVTMLHPPWGSRDQRRSFVLFFLLLGLGLGLLWLLFGAAYHEHLTKNVGTFHQQQAVEKFGAIPEVPFLSGIWVLWTYSKTLTLAFLAACLLLLGRLLRSGFRALTDNADPLLRPLVILGVAIWGEALAIDLLPTTKLARAHFLWFPGVCVFLALALRWLALWAPTRRRLVAVALALLLGGSAAEGVTRSMQIRESRLAAPRELSHNHPGARTILLLGEDPHGWFLAAWLRQWHVLGINSMPDFIQALHSNNRPEFVLLVGPTGKDSGNTILTNGCLPDFSFPVADFARQTSARLKPLPYYAYVPAFCLEEEVCEGLLYAGRIPDPARDPAKNLTLLYWPAPVPPGLSGTSSHDQSQPTVLSHRNLPMAHLRPPNIATSPP